MPNFEILSMESNVCTTEDVPPVSEFGTALERECHGEAAIKLWQAFFV